MQCYHCGKSGHIKKNCPVLKKGVNSARSKETLDNYQHHQHRHDILENSRLTPKRNASPSMKLNIPHSPSNRNNGYNSDFGHGSPNESRSNHYPNKPTPMSKAHRSIQFPKSSTSSSDDIDLRRIGSPKQKPWLSQSPNNYHQRRNNHMDNSPRPRGG
jgi:hypothetical protein